MMDPAIEPMLNPYAEITRLEQRIKDLEVILEATSSLLVRMAHGPYPPPAERVPDLAPDAQAGDRDE